MFKSRFIFLLVFILIFAGCISGRKLNRIAKEEKRIAAGNAQITFKELTITPQRRDNFRTTPHKQIDVLHADISVRFNWGKHECLGTEKILLKPYFYETDSILLDAKNMVFDGIKITDMQQRELQYLVSYDKKILKLKLERKIKSGDSLWLQIQYTARPDESEQGTGRAIRDDRGLYFINTDGGEPHKPVQIWTQGETESNSNWFPTIDNPNEKFTSSLSIQVPKEFVTLSNGKLISSVSDESFRTDVWVNELPMSAYLIMMAIGNFSITRDQWNQKEVSYYLEKDYEPFARRIFNHTVEMIQFFSDRLGVAYPWNKYAQVVVRDYVSGAMENTSATLHGEFVQKNNRELSENINDGIISHELFHQWFGDLVTCESWSHLVLNEGFASYGEQLWIEHKDGKDAALKKCYTTLERYLSYCKNNEDGPIINFNYKDKDDMFNVITYQKGSRVLHLLRTELGDDAFFLALKNFLNMHSFANAEIDDLRKEFEGVTGKDLRPFFQQWFLQGGHPVVNIRYEYNDSSKMMGVHVEQTQSADVGLFKFPLKFKVTQGNMVRYFTFPIQKKKELFFVQRFDEQNPEYPNVIVDPEATFIGEIIDNKSFLSHVVSYNQASGYVEKVRALTALSKEQKLYDTARITILSAITDSDEDIRLRALKWVDWSIPDNIYKTKEVLINLARNDVSAAVRSEIVKILGNMKDPVQLNLLVDLCSDSSYTVAGTALEAVYKLLPDQAYRLCTTLEHDAHGKLLEQIATIYARMGEIEKVNFFKQHLMKVFNRNRAMLIDQYALLIMNLKHDAELTIALDLFKQRAVSDKSPFVRYSAIKAMNDINAKRLTWLKESSDPASDHYKQDYANLKAEIESIILQERDKSVQDMLKANGLYFELKE